MFGRQRSYSNHHLTASMTDISQRSQSAGSVPALLIIFHILVAACQVMQIWMLKYKLALIQLVMPLDESELVYSITGTSTSTQIMALQSHNFAFLVIWLRSVTTYSRHLKSLEKYHQRCLRCIRNIKWQDRRTNSSVLEEANVTSIESILIKNQLRWAGHIVRMPTSRLPKKIFYGELCNGKRNQGGQRKRFKDNLNQKKPETMCCQHRGLGSAGQH